MPGAERGHRARLTHQLRVPADARRHPRRIQRAHRLQPISDASALRCLLKDCSSGAHELLVQRNAVIDAPLVLDMTGDPFSSRPSESIRPPWTGPVLSSLTRKRTPSSASMFASTRLCTSASTSARRGVTSVMPRLAVELQVRPLPCTSVAGINSGSSRIYFPALAIGRSARKELKHLGAVRSPHHPHQHSERGGDGSSWPSRRPRSRAQREDPTEPRARRTKRPSPRRG